MKNIRRSLMIIFTLLFACAIFGCGEPVKVSNIYIEGSGFMKVGETQTLSIEITPDNAENKEVEWSSSDNSLATVEDAVVTALKEGTVTITAKAKDGDVSESFSIIIEKNGDGGNEDGGNEDGGNEDGGNEDEKLSATTVKSKLQSVYSKYLAAPKAAIKLTLSSGEETLETYLSYEKSGDLYTKLFFEQKGDQEAGVYVKDEVVYMSANGTKQKYDLDESENATLVNSYGLDALIKDVVKFYTDSLFFNALNKATEDNSEFTFELDLSKYNGNTINAAGKDKIELIVALTNDEISMVTLKVTEGTLVNYIKLEYLGFNDSIVFPSDLNNYN